MLGYKNLIIFNMGDAGQWVLEVKKFLDDRVGKEIAEKKGLIEEIRKALDSRKKHCKQSKKQVKVKAKVFNAETCTLPEIISLNVFKVFNSSEKTENSKPKLNINTVQKSLKKSITQKIRPKNFRF